MSLKKALPSQPAETLLVIDATTGQNGMNQAKVFNEATDLTGIVLTKVRWYCKRWYCTWRLDIYIIYRLNM